MDVNFSTRTVFERVALSCGVIAAGIGGMGLVGWASGLQVLAGVRVDYIPMAPNTALAVILLGVALFSLIPWHKDPVLRTAIAGISAFCIILAVLTLVGIISDIDLQVDSLFLNPTGTMGAVPVGHMSPVTATCILLGGVAVLALLSRKNSPGALLGTVMTLTGGVIIIGYWYGAPLLYGGTVIPVALTTAVALGVLGVGLVAAAGPGCWPLSSVTGPSTRARLLRGLLPVTLALVLLVDWVNTVVGGHAGSSVVLLSALMAILSLLVVYGVVTYTSREIGDAIDRAERERKRAEAALRDSEEKYRVYVNNSPEGIFIVDASGNYRDANPSAYSMLGYSREELLSLTIRDLTPASGLAGALEDFQKLKETGSLMAELQLKKKSGDILPVIMNAVRLSDERYLAFCTDITRRKQGEEALRESKALVDAVVENVPLMIFLKEAVDLRFVIFNKAGEELLGYDRAALLGKNNLDLFPADQAANFMAKDREVLDGDIGTLDIPEEFILTAKKGQRLLHTRKVCIRGADGTTKFLLGISEDITEHKQEEENLKFSNLLLSTQQEVSPDGILVVDGSGKIISFNNRFAEMWQIPPDVIASHSDERALQSVIGRLVSPDEFLSRVRYLYEHKDERSQEEIALLDGRTIDRYSAPMVGSDGNYYGRVWFFRDITDRKRMEMSLRREKDLWRGTFDSIPDLLAIIDTKHRVVQMNRAMADILKVTPDAAQEVFCYRAVHGTTTPPDYCPHDLLLKDKKTHTTDVFLPLLNGYYSITTSPLFRSDGSLFGSVHLAHDITERKKAEELLNRFNEELEQKVRERTDQLLATNMDLEKEVGERARAEERIRASLDEKEVLLREIHHRVKNNLQIIISLLNLQARYIGDEKIRQTLNESQNRVRAMAQVHEKLYQSPDVTKIELDNYLKYLGNSLLAFYGVKEKQIIFTTQIVDIHVGLDTAIPIGLIVNELTSNSVKHAFPEGRKGEITLAIRQENARITIQYRDNGAGIPGDFDWRNAESLGLRLVILLVEQLDGTIELDRSSGTEFTIVVKEKE